MKTIGVLALQGAFREHISKINSLGHNAVEVKLPQDLDKIDGIILPGGESTAISKLLNNFRLMEPLKNKIQNGLPCLGTCAGMILMAKSVENNEVPTLGVMDIHVQRNAYGRQLGSFETIVKIEAISSSEIPLVFIRAPYIKEVRGNAKAVFTLDNRIVAARESNMLALSFHPELTSDLTVHEYFLKMI